MSNRFKASLGLHDGLSGFLQIFVGERGMVRYKHILSKIGQYPSLADFDSQDVKQYRKALGENNYVILEEQ
jgi:hypothetical protein